MSNTYNTKHKTVYGCPKSGAHRKKKKFKDLSYSGHIPRNIRTNTR